MRQDGEEFTDGEASQWRLEAGGYPPPGLRAGRGREGGGDSGGERLRQDGDGEEDYRGLYQRERQEREVSRLTSRGTKMLSQLNSFAHSIFFHAVDQQKVLLSFPPSPCISSQGSISWEGEAKRK